LVASETLRDLGNDRVIFRHDVLREWAIANFLFADPTLLARLPLDRPTPPDLARGVELAARLAIERTANSDAWYSFLAALNKDGVNPSWSRAVLLALVRSEIAAEALNKGFGSSPRRSRPPVARAYSYRDGSGKRLGGDILCRIGP
jgi:hypothetical protein